MICGPFGEKTVARKITMLGGDVNKMEITIDSVEPAASVSESLFTLSGVKALYTSGEEDQRFTQPRSLYRETFSPWLAWEGDLRSQNRRARTRARCGREGHDGRVRHQTSPQRN